LYLYPNVDTIIDLLGQGTFGKVVEVYHTKTHQKYAIKIIKSIQKYADASKVEIRILNELKERDPNNY
jgi:dual-specificity kinase